ncbi:MAG: TetR family transcriptional regulator [Streptomyces sp.]|nr:TetR family transcriptional regulator [Streptomyces sp.]
MSGRWAGIPDETPGPSPLGLRELKKLRVRLAIQRAAVELFQERGFEAVTVAQICRAADVSRSTFFRYFPTKEDVVLLDHYDPLISEAIAARPRGEPPLTAVRRGLTGEFLELFRDDQELFMARARLVMSVPALRSRMWEGMRETEKVFATVLGRRSGRAPEDFEVRITAATLSAALVSSVEEWTRHGGRVGLVDLFHQALDQIESGLRL